MLGGIYLGNDFDNILVGSDGDDSITAFGGDDTVEGGLGADIMSGGSGEDTLRYTGSGAGVSVSLLSGTGLFGDAQGDLFAFFENITGSAHNDTLTGDDADNVLRGEGGDDTIVGGGGNDDLIGGGGGDNLSGGDGHDVLIGGSGADVLSGGAIVDSINGGTGNDLVEGGDGGDFMGGGDGADTLSYAGSDGGVIVYMASGVAYNNDAAGDTFDYFENVIGSAHGDNLYGDAGPNVLTGGADNDNLRGGDGNDQMWGGAGDDFMHGGAGADHFDGGGGSDAVSYSDSGAAIHVNLTAFVAGGGDAEGDTIQNVRGLQGSDFDDDLTGDLFNNFVYGGGGDDEIAGEGGNDALYGLEGDDLLDGGTGIDQMFGWTGNDLFFVDNADDDVFEYAAEGYDSVHTTLAVYTLAENVERLYTDTAAGIAAVGNALDNRLYGNNGEDRFRDYAGGADNFSGGNGSDSMYFTNTGAAVLDFAAGLHGGSAAGDNYNSIENFFGSNAEGDTMTAGAGRAVFNGQGGDDTLSGGANHDKLYGGAGTDTLSGGGGNDSIQGGAGNDGIAGGAGNDQFVFAETILSGGWGADSISDWEDGADLLKVSSATGADAFADFTIAGNGTADVTISLIAAPANTIALHGAGAITITAEDFLFY